MKKKNIFDYIIIGAGPAGLQLGYYFEQNNQDYLILEGKENAGSFFEKFPRKKTLISFNKVHNIYDDPEILLRWDWNSLLTDDYSFPFKNYSKKFYPHSKDMVAYLNGFAEHFKLKIRYGTKITKVIKKAENLFCIQDEDQNTIFCKSLIIATGFSKEYIPNIPGIEVVKESYANVSLDPEEFTGQRVLIIGKGNSAFEIADSILETASIIHLASPDTVKFAWNTRHPGHLRANNAQILDAYQLKLLHSVLDCTIKEIYQEDGKFVVAVKYVHAEDEEEEIIYDRVIRCTGFRFDKSIFDDSCMPKTKHNDKLPALTSSYESINVSGLYFAGTLMQVRDFQKAGSAFIDGFRYNIRTLHHFLSQRYETKHFPHQDYPLDPEKICKNLLHRICTTSGLWTQFGYLCDVLVIDGKNKKNRFYEELPLDYVLEDSPFSRLPHYYTITFEWGPWSGDVFAIDRHPSHQKADASAFLHPVIRRYSRKKLIATHHILEDLFGMYSTAGEAYLNRSRSYRSIEDYHFEEHEQPLLEFLSKQLVAEIRPLQTQEAKQY